MRVRTGLYIAALFTALFALNARGVELKTPEEARDYASQIKYRAPGVSWFLTFYKGRDKRVLTDFNYGININSILQR